MKSTIYIQQIGELDKSVLVDLKNYLELEFKNKKISIIIIQEQIQLEDSEYNSKEEQYKADQILNRLIKLNKNKHYFRLLGVMDNDIYTKNYKFIFGITRLYSNVALISITRLREKFYEKLGSTCRKPKNKKIFDLRVLKEAIHELGHTFGLKHCSNFCVMLFSNCLADTDKKPAKYCPSCLKIIKTSQIY